MLLEVNLLIALGRIRVALAVLVSLVQAVGLLRVGVMLVTRARLTMTLLRWSSASDVLPTHDRVVRKTTVLVVHPLFVFVIVLGVDFRARLRHVYLVSMQDSRGLRRAPFLAFHSHSSAFTARNTSVGPNPDLTRGSIVMLGLWP